MSDIFGYQPADYTHMRDMQSLGEEVFARHMQARHRNLGGEAHDFAGLERLRDMGNAVHGRAELDAQALGYLTNNLQAMMSQIDEILYTEDRLAEMIPVMYNAPEGATSFAYRVVDRVGEGRYISLDGTDAPSANVGVRLVTYPLDYAGIIASWTIEDLRRAVFSMIPLDSETLRAGAQGAAFHMQAVGFTGSDQLEGNPRGLINQATSTVDYTNSGVTDFSGATADDIVAYIQGRISALIENSAEVLGRTIRGELCIYLPLAEAHRLSTIRIGDSGMNAQQYLLANNPWTDYGAGNRLSVKPLLELKDAGAGSTQRMIIAPMDARVHEMQVAIMPRVITTVNNGYRVDAPMEYKFSPYLLKRPTLVQYTDGV